MSVQVATKLIRLEDLVLSGCTSLALHTVQGFPAMTSLDLSRCKGLQPTTAVRLLPNNPLWPVTAVCETQNTSSLEAS